MTIEALAEQSSHVIETDVCIIGAGAAGITVALQLARTSRRVVLVESGGERASGDDRPAYRALPGREIELGTDRNRPLYLGGNTNHWFGNCRPLDAFDLEHRDWIPESGWPIRHGDLEPYYERAQAIAGLGDMLWYDVSAAEPLLPRQARPLESRRLDTKLAQTTPVFSFADRYRAHLERAPEVRTVVGAHVTRLVADPTGERVVAAELAVRDGSRRRVEADTFVLASGGIENARILLSSDEHHPHGLGNGHDLVGRYFMEHWFFAFAPETTGLDARRGSELEFYNGGIGDRETHLHHHRHDVCGASVWAQLATSEAAMRSEQVPGASLWLRPTRRVPGHLEPVRRLASRLRRGQHPTGTVAAARAAISDPGGTIRFLRWRLSGRGAPSHDREVLLQLEQTPDRDNRITLAEERDRYGERIPQLDLEMDADQIRAHGRSIRLIAEELGLNGDRMVDAFEKKYERGDFDFFWHHMGTTRMSDDPATGVVDADGCVHGVTNLYVTGSSVFPTGGTAGPTLTLVALAARLGDHLAGVGNRPDAADDR